MVDFKKHLDDRIRALGKSAGPSLVPQPYVPQTRAAAEPEVIPDISASIKGPTLMRVRRLVQTVVEQKMVERAAKRSYTPVVEDLKRLLAPVGEVKAMVGETRLNYYETTRTSISRQLLLDQGVSPAVIAAATVTSPSWTLKVGLPGGDDE